MSNEATEFVVYIINEIANKKEKYPSHVYKLLKKTACIEKYLGPFYDVLHTMSSEMVVRDVLEYVEARGEKL